MLITIRIIIINCILIIPLQAQFEGIKIMINPGHGGHDSDDRYIPATGFWESESNLTKGLHLRDLLEDRGAEVIMSRTQNRTIDDLPLSQISAIANSNNVDYFQSIHSNGFQGTANRTAVFWEQLSNGQPDFPQAKQASEILAEKIFEVDYTTSYSDRGDLTYLGYNLGVLRNLNMPGCLTEGSFHDFIPESYRLLNLDYRKHEAVAILRGMLQYFNLPPLEYGAVAGLVKNKYDLVSYNYDGGNYNDRYKPINNILASLYQDTVLLRRYHGDFNNNGYFVFDSVASGNYTLLLENGYFKTDTLQISINNNQTAFVESYPQVSNLNAPKIYETYPKKNQQDINTYSSLRTTFSQRMQQDSTIHSFSILPQIAGNFSWKENGQILQFDPQIAFTPQTEYQVTFSTSAENTSGISLQNSYVFNFTTAQDHIYPVLSKTIPQANDSITVFEHIEMFFDQDMNRDKVQNAFSIIPPVNGTFNWTDERHVIFYPDSLSTGTVYSVTISDSAQNTFSVGLHEDYSFQFKTYQRNSLNVIAAYPEDGSTSVSTRVNFYIHFDGLLDASTVLTNVALYDSIGNAVKTVSHKLEEKNNTSVLRFNSEQQLKNSTSYTLIISPGIKDLDALLLKDTLSYTFRTDRERYVSGSIVDDFEDDTGWQKPASAAGSINIDTVYSDFSISFVEKISGSKSAMIAYRFTDDSVGICQVFREEGYNLNLSGSNLGLWVYGDYSYNLIEIWYDSSFLQNQAKIIDTLDFSGWKLLKIPGTFFEDPNINLHSIVIKRLYSGYAQGKIYIDDLQTDIITDLSIIKEPLSVPHFQLFQNYPNPFNPLTIIKYQIPKTSSVKLIVYNVLGQEIETLVDKKQGPGIYQVFFNADNLTSGIYFYTLETKSGFRQSRKFLLLK